MIIICQNRKRTINFERVEEFYINYNKEKHTYSIKAKTATGNEIFLAIYSSEIQANNVYNTLNQVIACAGNIRNLDGSMQLQLPAYYMPEEIKEEKENK